MQKSQLHNFISTLIILIIIATISCLSNSNTMYEKGTFGYDLQILQKYGNPIVLSNADSSQAIVVMPEYQGRVMTSTASGMQGLSYGWINYELISSGKTDKQFNPFGGEDRFWMGPEGGQFGLFFKKDEPFSWEFWQVPYWFDKDTFSVVESTSTSIRFEEYFTVQNYSGHQFKVGLNRRIDLLSSQEIIDGLNLPVLDSVNFVGFKSTNQITNQGNQEWSDMTGKLSIWILGAFIPSATNTVIIPLNNGGDKSIEETVNTGYYWDVPKKMLRKSNKVVFFKADGNFQCKIGVKPIYSTSFCGSYNSDRNLLTIVRYNFQHGRLDYVNSMFEYQENPYEGDALNFYNDGIPIGGSQQYGPFYEIETSSLALGLKPRESYVHIHETYHFQGKTFELDNIAHKLLGIRLNEIPEF